MNPTKVISVMNENVRQYDFVVIIKQGKEVGLTLSSASS